MPANPTAMESLFRPRGIAVVGASSNPQKVGSKIVSNILAGGYEGRVYPVNPKGGDVLGLPAVTNLRAIDGPVDVAVIVVPANAVYAALEDCAARHVPVAVVISSGFSEVGNSEEERRIAAFAREHGIRLVGPNVFGFYSAASRLNATFGPADIRPGNVAIITQSGAIGIAMIGKTAADHLGLSAIVSVGNKCDVDEADLVDYLVEDPATGIILMYIEGVKDGRRLIASLQAATRQKPIIVIKSGRSQRGAVAVASHTGSLAGSDEVFDAIMRQCGVLRAESIQEALDWSLFLSRSAPLSGENTVIVTNGGGIGVLATDACEKFGVKLYDNLPVLREAFASATPDFGSVKNPVDLTGQASGLDYQKALEAALASPHMDAVIALYCETALISQEQLKSVIQNAYKGFLAKKPVVFSMFGGERLNRCTAELRQEGVPVFGEVYDAVSCLGTLVRSTARRCADSGEFPSAPVDTATIDRVAAGALAAGRRFLLAPEAQQVMRAAGLPLPQSGIAKSLTQVIELAEQIGYPVVLKVVSKDILHKSDAGGVALDLVDRQEVMDAHQAIVASCRKYNPRATIEGFEVSQMVEKGVETIIGARKDKTFGPIIMFGLGGIYVEVMKDVSFRSWPVTLREADEMVGEIKSYPLLLGVRGEKRKDIPRILDAIVRVGTIIERCPAVTDIEVNPLVAYEQGEGAIVLDARILVAP